jgi:hypothetical protein
MKNNFHIKERLQKLSKKSGAIRDPQLMHPEREWVIGLLGALTLLLFSISLGAYIYFKNQTVDVQVNADEAAQVVYRESIVEQVLMMVDDRADTLQSLSAQSQGPEIVEEEETASTTETEIIPETASTTSQ